MSTSYNEQQQAARARLRAAMHPASTEEHAWVDWLLSNMTPTEADVWSEMSERRVRTSVRAARMALADHVLDRWQPSAAAGSVELVERMMLVASGGQTIAEVIEPEDDDVQPSSETVADAVQRSREVASAYDRGYADAVTWCREQQSRGLDPELWTDRP